MPTEGDEAVAAIIGPARRRTRRARGPPRHALRRGAQGQRRRRARQYAEVAEQVRRWTGQLGRGRRLLRSASSSGSRARTAPSCRAAHGCQRRHGVASACSCPTSWSRRAGQRRVSGASVYALASRYFLGAEVDLDETYAWGWTELQRLYDRMAETADRILPGATSTRPSPTSTPTPTGSSRPRGVPRLDAGARRPDHRRPRRRALRHPRPDPPDRVHARPHQRRRHLLHRPVRGLQPPGPDVVVGARRHRGLPPVARGHDRLPRGRPRPSPAGRARRPTAGQPQPLAAADVLGAAATARAGRCTPSG